jgi:hypothetical protein
MNTKHLIYALGITLGLSSVPSTVLAQTQDTQSQDPSKQTTTVQPQDADLEQKLRSLIDEEGEPLFPDYAFSRFRSDDVDLSYALRIADLIDVNGRRLVEGFVPSYTITELYKSGASIEDIIELASLSDKNGYGMSLLGIINFFEEGGTVDIAKRLNSITDAEGTPIFSSHEYDSYLESGGTPEFADTLSGITKKDGKPVFDTGTLMSSFLDAGGTIEFARSLTDMIDQEGELVFDSAYDINGFLETGGTLQIARDLFALRDRAGNQIFDGYGMKSFLEEEGTLDLAKQYVAIESPGDRPFFRGLNMAMFMDIGGTVQYAQLFADINKEEGEQIFNGSNIFDFAEAGGHLRYARELIDIKDREGKPVFTDGFYIAYYKEHGGTIPFARELASLTDEQGNPSIDQSDIYRIQREGVTLDKVREIHAARDAYDGSMFDGHSIYRFAHLGLSEDEVNFRDTDRPNAVVIYPTNDWNGAFENEQARAFFHSIKGEYDVLVRLAETEEDVYSAINRVPDIELLILGGHGSEKSLSLGETDLGVREAEKKDERYTLDLSDQELGPYLSRLDPQAVIFLNSCSNAKGDNGDNIADFIANMAGGRTVIAATEPFGAPDVTINQMHPFDITILGGLSDNRRDITYRTPN